MGTRYLLDTNAVLNFMGRKLSTKSQFILSEIIDTEINISAISKIELLGFSFVEQTIIDFVSFAEVYPIDNETIDKTIDLRKRHKIKLPDAIIAATAIVHDFTLLTSDAGFNTIPNLHTLNPFDL